MCKFKKSYGIIILCVGMGLVLAIIIPLWGWILLVGGALIFGGWYLINHHD